MIRNITTFFVALVAAVTVAVSPAAADHPPLMLGPGDAGVSDMGGSAIIRYSKFGPVYISGKHSQHLTVKWVESQHAIRFRDTRTGRFKSLPDRCTREKVKVGLSAVCKVPPRFNKQKMYIQVWPRLGNDFTDGRTLPARFRLWVLTDAGNDVTYGGDGADFVNGAKGNDRIYGGAGHDWLRGGPGADRIVGGGGGDRVSHG
ncbi:calcium-binding protein [Nocardioides humilatus]|nr:calcium-binding protein [Nocardioides humilatus]